MIRRLLVLVTFLAAQPVLAQEEAPPPPPPEGEPDPGFTIEEEGEKPPSPTPEAEPVVAEPKGKELKLGETRASWQDIVVVIRKPFLKMSRFELVPSTQLTLNDNMITHYGFDGEINYWLTDVLAVGVEGVLFEHSFRETYNLVARQDRRLPTLNQYNFGASLNFHYVPIYAKFAVFNRKIVHLEGFFTAGVGFTQSEVIPRDPKFEAWKNFLVTPNVGFTMRVFLTKWITLNVGLKDYVFIDKYESVDRSEGNPNDPSEVTMAKENADSKLINHIMFQAGLSFWFPTSFHYTTFR